MEKHICNRCGNSDQRFFGIRNGEIYCRKCLMFQGEKADNSYIPKSCKVNMKFKLSKKQEEISLGLIENFKNGKNALLHAVTGAGKTELSYGVIEYALSLKKHVGFALPRVDIVIDLLPRFKQDFKDAKVIGVYGGNHEKLEGDIIILTTHQLYRYEGYFDLIILDEIDAFPFKNNLELNYFFRKALIGNYVLMSATATEKEYSIVENDNGKVFLLMERYHHYPLPVPVFIKESSFPKIQILNKLLFYFKKNKPVFIFAPTINTAKNLGLFLHLFFKNGRYFSSESPDRKKIISDFKKGFLKYLVTTSILERGVTVKDLQVIVYLGHYDIYDQATLVQIAGRVGRKINAEKGEVIIYGKRETREIKNAIKFIEDCNKKAGL